MRVIITADLHYRPSLRDVYLDFAGQIQALRPDCFIIAGDIGHPLRLFRRALQLFAGLDCPRLLVAGNHDVYRGEHDSRTLWQQALPQVTAEEGFVWLEGRSLRLPLSPLAPCHRPHPGGRSQGAGRTAWPAPEAAAAQPESSQLAVCGTMGWYDYSSRAPHLTYTDKEYRALKPLVSHDADYIDWPWSDRAVARYLARGFDACLTRLEADPAVRQILVVTHVPIFEPAIPRHPESEFWSLVSAYLGNFSLGRLVRRYAKVSHVISGHLHRAGRWAIQGDHGLIDFRLVGSQKGSPRTVILDF